MSTQPATATSQPEHIGPYRVLETLGEGGMGIVYLAEQREPVRRRVAVKVVKLGMDSKAVLARFEAERRALAMMEHSCIATVFDAGLTAAGQPFFAMEYVKGIPITDYCDQNKLSLKERIELFQKVCSGVQHAHLKGVMHRDLKPGNVLVTLQDGKATPKIIDFGLAKATDHHLVEATLFTAQGVVIGTPEYMSPEQAGLGGLDVDTRTDVYSLGVLLYELLVGELPFPKKTLREAGLLEMQRLIREQEPPKPSTKVTTLGDGASGHAAARRLEARELQKKLRGDLDWIVLRAMEKDRTRRYETAQELAADLGRHLGFEPVLASPPSVAYRVRKFVRRYRVQCLAAAVVFLAITGGAVGTWLGFAAATERAAQIAAMAEKDQVYVDVARIAEAIREEETLWPAWPDKAPAMRTWLAKYEPLLQRASPLAGQLGELEKRALPRTAAEREAARNAHPRQPELARLRSELEQENDEGVRADLVRRIRDLEKEITLAGFEFADTADGYTHRTLARLVNDLGAFTKRLQAVEERLAEAETVQDDSIDDHRAAWERAIAEIAASERYGRLVLNPQVGLVPIGMDRTSMLQEFVHLASGTPDHAIPSRHETTGSVVPTAGMGIVFVLIPGGALPVEESQTADDRHAVRLTPFLLSKYETTQGQWQRLIRREHSDIAPVREMLWSNEPLLPISSVNWFECEVVSRHSGCQLPSSLQWEYACRAGTATPWWTGAHEQSLNDLENTGSSTSHEPLPVGTLAPNAFGLFDMAGNVAEWCDDELWSADEQAHVHLTVNQTSPDPRPRHVGFNFRLVRGSSCHYESGAEARSSAFGTYAPTTRLGNIGTRFVRPIVR